MAGYVAEASSVEGWLSQASEVFSDRTLTKNKYTPSLRSAFKELTVCYKEHIISWWEVQSFENYLKQSIVPRGLRIPIVPSNRLRTPDLMEKWEKEATESALRFMNLLLEEEKKKLDTANIKLKEQIEITLKFKQDPEYTTKEAQLQNTIERFLFNLKERKHSQFIRDLQDFRDNKVYTLLDRRDRRQQDTDTSSSDTDGFELENHNKRGNRGRFNPRYNRRRGSNRTRGPSSYRDHRNTSPPGNNEPSTSDPKDNFSYYFITPWIGKGLLVLSGPKWHQHRKLLTQGFHYDVLKPYVRLMSNCVNVMLDKWEKLVPDKKPVELFHHVSLMTLDTIMKCAFGYESDCQNNSENAYIKAVYELSYLVDHRFRCFPYHNDFIFYMSPHGFRFRRALNIAHQHTEKVIKLRKESLKQETELEKIKQKRHLDFLDILLCAKDENGQGLSDEDLRAEVDTFMFEGHDTTASGISWTLYCLAKYPEHQEKCREEIREVLGKRTSVEWEDLGKLPYTTMCIKESMRLYPPVPGVARELKEPITFFDGRSLPKGTVILLSMFCMNRSPSMWDNPEVFDPLRFSPDNSSKRHSHMYVPFSAGSRNCIGQNFAMNEMKIAIALTLPRFELSIDPNNEPLKIPQLVLRSVNGIHINLKKIERAS